MKKIAFTFAGRRDRMKNQLVFMSMALERGIVDEWHLWNFARNPADDAWLRQRFADSASLITDEQSIDYQPFLAKARSFALSVRARNDAHLRIRTDTGELVEVVLGAFDNTRSLLRTFERGVYRLHAPARAVAGKALDPAGENVVSVALEGTTLTVRLRGELLFDLDTRAALIELVEVHTGYGASGEWREAKEPARVQLKNAVLKHYRGFRLAYDYYSAARFGDAVFVKLDDDIVYCDIEKFGLFVEDLVADGELAILSANVINNGVCAHLQERRGLFAGEAFGFEYPPEGTGGKLWESSRLCERLHGYFLSHRERILQIASAFEEKVEIPLADRFSINFVGFGYPIMLMMKLAFQQGHEDDEHAMTRVITRLFGVRKYIFLRFVVSHLSFFRQDETLDAKHILMGYSRLYP